MDRAVGVILAAGKGVRMKSELPKALQKIAGVPILRLIVEAMKSAGIARIIVVVGHKGEAIQSEFGDEVEYAWQHEQLGTGHAVSVTKDLLKGFKGAVVIAPGDTPLLDTEFFEFLLQAHGTAACTLATAVLDNPAGYGRIVRDAHQNPSRIVEEKDAAPDQKRIKEINASIYCFDGVALFNALPSLRNTNAQGEYYLTDLVSILYSAGRTVQAVPYLDSSIVVGVNDRWQLAQAEKTLQLRLLRKHALNGVSILDLDSTYIGPYVRIGREVVIEPGTVILGRTTIGDGCAIGPNCRIENAAVGDNSRIVMSHVQDSTLGRNVKCGPFANLRPGTVLGDGVKIGNFVEVKKSVLGENVSASHLSYLGDSEIGADTNIGAGVITCNFDGFTKSKTTIGSEVFVGSNVTLVAPLTIEKGAMIAAGSTITSDIPVDSAGFGRARQETKPGWAAKWREKRRLEK